MRPNSARDAHSGPQRCHGAGSSCSSTGKKRARLTDDEREARQQQAAINLAQGLKQDGTAWKRGPYKKRKVSLGELAHPHQTHAPAPAPETAPPKDGTAAQRSEISRLKAELTAAQLEVAGRRVSRRGLPRNVHGRSALFPRR